MAKMSLVILEDYQSYDLKMKVMLSTTNIRFWVRQHDCRIVDDGSLAVTVLEHLAHTHWGSIPSTTTGQAGDMFPALACEDDEAKKIWVAHGCNAFERRPPISLPIAFWLPEDITEYATLHSISRGGHLTA